MDAQSIAERKRRETSLNADALRQHDITVSDGKRQAVVNEAEAHKRKIILSAEADRESMIMKAETDAIAIEKIGVALSNNPEAAKYLLAKEYLDNMSKLLPKSTVFLPKDIGDINRLIASATSINASMKDQYSDVNII